MTSPEEQPTVGDFLARLEFKYNNDVLDFLKTGKGVVVVEDKIANIPLPAGAPGKKGDIGKLREGDVRFLDDRKFESETAATNSSDSADKAKASEEAAKVSETNAKASEEAAKNSGSEAQASEEAAKVSETNAKTSETNAKASEDSARADRIQTGEDRTAAEEWAGASADSATLAIAAATTVTQYVGTGFPEGKVTAPVGAIYTDTAATAGAIRWIKTSGADNSGWQVEYGDTGLRNISSSLAVPGSAWIQRVGDLVTLILKDIAVSESVSSKVIFPAGTFNGWMQDQPFTGILVEPVGTSRRVQIPTNGQMTLWYPKAGDSLNGTLVWRTASSWPAG